MAIEEESKPIEHIIPLEELTKEEKSRLRNIKNLEKVKDD